VGVNLAVAVVRDQHSDRTGRVGYGRGYGFG
jgi:hypothetical protein